MDDYDMYTSEGNKAVARALAAIDLVAKDHTKVWNRQTLNDVASPCLQEVAKRHGEIYDTEPRGLINDYLDGICKVNGWHYDEWDEYNW